MNRLEKYTSGQVPVAGDCGPYDYCANAMSYKPYDVSGLSGQIASKFDACIQNVETEREVILRQLDEASDAWGTKFIEINGSSLNLIHSEYYTRHLDSIRDNITQTKETAMAEIAAIEAGTEEVNAYLTQLQANYNEYQSLKAQLDSIKSRHYSEEDEWKRAQALSEFFSAHPNYDSYKDIGEPDGTWVIG